MTKNRIFILIGLVVMMSISSCGIFGKGCGCPTFGYVDHVPASSPLAINHDNTHRDTF